LIAERAFTGHQPQFQWIHRRALYQKAEDRASDVWAEGRRLHIVFEMNGTDHQDRLIFSADPGK